MSIPGQMKKYTVLFMIIIFASCKLADKKSSDETKNERTVAKNDWMPLLDGKTTAGWHTYGQDSAGKAWNIDDSALHLDASSKADWQTKDGGDIVSNDEFGNFDLQLDWKISEGGNSGIMFYVQEDTSKYKYTWYTGRKCRFATMIKMKMGKCT